MSLVEDQEQKTVAAFLGAQFGEQVAAAPAAAGDMLEVAASIAAGGDFDAEDLKRRGLTGASQCGPSGLLVRALPYAMLSPLDRPRVRRNAYRVAQITGADEATAVATVAAAFLAADLYRFDIQTAVIRVRQSLLEDAPFALLEHLAPLHEFASVANDEDPLLALQLAITALSLGDNIVAAVRALPAGLRAARALAGAYAGVRDGFRGVDETWRTSVPHSSRAQSLASGVAERATAAATA